MFWVLNAVGCCLGQFRLFLTKYHRLNGLNNRNCSTVLEAGNSEIRMPAWSDSGEGPLPGSQKAVFAVSSDGGEIISLVSLFIRTLILFMRALPS